MKRSIWCVALHFDINRAIVGKILLNFERKIRYLLSRIMSSLLSAHKSPNKISLIWKSLEINFCDLRRMFSSFQKVLTLLQ